MILYPAIDIQGGNVVRLLQGNFDQATEYSGDPVIVAKKWVEKGAQWIHVVDLDGAKTGQIQNIKAIQDIAHSVSVPIQMGGGVRSIEDIEQLIAAGVERVVLGTKAIGDKPFLDEIVKKFQEKIAISLDCHDGKLAQRGWQEKTEIKAKEFIKTLESIGVQCVIFTDIARDGMLTGPNYQSLEELADVSEIPIIASGGIASIDDIKKLKSLEPKGITGAITGKAIYEGKLDFAEAIKLC